MPEKRPKTRRGAVPNTEPKPVMTTLNLSIEKELKADAVAYIESLGYKAAEYITAFLEIQLIQAGIRPPKKPIVEPVPELLVRKG